MKAKWTLLFEVATHDWLNKKRVANNKSMPVDEGLRHMLDMWLKKGAQIQHDNVTNFFALYVTYVIEDIQKEL